MALRADPRTGDSQGMRLGSLLVLIWLVIGVFAAFQRGYITDDDADCAHVGTVLLTVVAGPLNYVGLNPTVEGCEVPEPSQ